jgi:hypothetical protein
MGITPFDSCSIRACSRPCTWPGFPCLFVQTETYASTHTCICMHRYGITITSWHPPSCREAQQRFRTGELKNLARGLLCLPNRGPSSPKPRHCCCTCQRVDMSSRLRFTWWTINKFQCHGTFLQSNTFTHIKGTS